MDKVMSLVCQTALCLVKFLISEFISWAVFIRELVHRRKYVESIPVKIYNCYIV